MRRIIFSLLLFCSLNVRANQHDDIAAMPKISPIEINHIFDEHNTISIIGLPDFIDRQEKIDICMAEYIKKQSKSYARIVQNNLYDLIHNFNKITSEIYGKKIPKDEIPYEEKIEALAKIQCEAYYTMEVLK